MLHKLSGREWLAQRIEGQIKRSLPMVCPLCQGAEASEGIACSDTGCLFGTMACSYCDGRGRVSAAAAQRWHDGRVMREARVSQGTSQKEQAYLLGISMTQLNDLEHGRPTRVKLNRIKAGLEILEVVG